MFQLPSQRENLVRVTVDGSSGIGELEITAGAREQLGADGSLQRMQLSANRRLREVQLPAGFGDCPLAGNRPEIEQMVIVKSMHGKRSYIGNFDISINDYSICSL